MKVEDKLNKETLEQAADRLTSYYTIPAIKKTHIESFTKGAKWQQERMYSEEDLRNAYRHGIQANYGTEKHFNEWFEQFKIKK